MIFLSAGHNSKSKNIKPDPGATGNGYKEGDLTILMRDEVAKILTAKGIKFITDSDEESLAIYLKRIKTGSGSVVIEYHLDAANSSSATGTTAIVEEDADSMDKAFAKELVDTTASTLCIQNRGVKSESYTYHKRLGLMREEGIICLVELCFISNASDVKKFLDNYKVLAKLHADIIIKYENAR